MGIYSRDHVYWDWSPLEVASARQSGACEVLEKPMQIDEWLEIPARIENVLASAETHAIH